MLIPIVTRLEENVIELILVMMRVEQVWVGGWVGGCQLLEIKLFRGFSSSSVDCRNYILSFVVLCVRTGIDFFFAHH